MCRLASMYVTQHAVLWSKTSDSHAAIAREHGLVEQSAEMAVGRKLASVPVEVYPENLDYSRPIGEWVVHLDENVRRDLLPDWWDEADARSRCAAALAEWAKYHIIESGEHEASGEISLIVRGTATLNVTGQTGGNCVAYDSATLNATGQTGGYCEAHGSATLNATGQTGGYCWAFGSATLNATGQTGGYCWAHDSATLNATGQTGGYCWAHDSATLNRIDAAKAGGEK